MERSSLKRAALRRKDRWIWSNGNDELIVVAGEARFVPVKRPCCDEEDRWTWSNGNDELVVIDGEARFVPLKRPDPNEMVVVAHDLDKGEVVRRRRGEIDMLLARRRTAPRVRVVRTRVAARSPRRARRTRRAGRVARAGPASGDGEPPAPSGRHLRTRTAPAQGEP
jgi:hypothetical protein